MTPGGAAGAETDGEGPLKHSVMKRSTVNSLTRLAFQMNPARVPCLIYSGNPHLTCFYKCRRRTAADAAFLKLFWKHGRHLDFVFQYKLGGEGKKTKQKTNRFFAATLTSFPFEKAGEKDALAQSVCGRKQNAASRRKPPRASTQALPVKHLPEDQPE